VTQRKLNRITEVGKQKNMEKTAMMELIEWMKKFKYADGISPIAQGAFEIMEFKATELLEKEKNQIVESFVAGSERGTKDNPFNAEQYFIQTFKKD
jgi:hypothetical protein